MENYKLDSIVISEILSNEKYTKSVVTSEGDVNRMIKDLAFDQLDSLAARQAYLDLSYLNSSATKGDLEGDVDSITKRLFDRMRAARDSLPTDGWEKWSSEFDNAVKNKKAALSHQWESRWKDLCDGKVVIEMLYLRSKMKVPLASFKELIIQRMRDSRSDDWTLVKSMLEELLSSARI